MQLAESLLREGRFAEAVEQTELALEAGPECRSMSAPHRGNSSRCCARRWRRRDARLDETPAPTGDDFFGPTELANIEGLIAGYTASPADSSLREHMHGMQSAPSSTSSAVPRRRNSRPCSGGDLGKVYRAILQSGLTTEVPTTQMQAAVKRSRCRTCRDRRRGYPRAADSMLCAPAHRGTMTISPAKVPAWWLEDYLGYVLHAPQAVCPRRRGGAVSRASVPLPAGCPRAGPSPACRTPR